jgi:hypothetical protein
MLLDRRDDLFSGVQHEAPFELVWIAAEDLRTLKGWKTSPARGAPRPVRRDWPAAAPCGAPSPPAIPAERALDLAWCLVGRLLAGMAFPFVHGLLGGGGKSLRLVQRDDS